MKWDSCATSIQWITIFGSISRTVYLSIAWSNISLFAISEWVNLRQIKTSGAGNDNDLLNSATSANICLCLIDRENFTFGASANHEKMCQSFNHFALSGICSTGTLSSMLCIDSELSNYTAQCRLMISRANRTGCLPPEIENFQDRNCKFSHHRPEIGIRQRASAMRSSRISFGAIVWDWMRRKQCHFYGKWTLYKFPVFGE